MQLYIGNKNYSSWSMRPWVALRHFGIPFEEVRLRFDSFDAGSDFKAAIGRVTPTGCVPVLVDEGDFVTAGDVLARMDTAVLKAQLREAQAQLRQAKSSIAVAHSQVTQRESEKAAADAVVAQREAERDVAKKRLERTESLAKQSATSQQQLDEDQSARLKELKLPQARLKTGTPPRLDGRTIDFAKCMEQPGDVGIDETARVVEVHPCRAHASSVSIYAESGDPAVQSTSGRTRKCPRRPGRGRSGARTAGAGGRGGRSSKPSMDSEPTATDSRTASASAVSSCSSVGTEKPLELRIMSHPRGTVMRSA